MNRPSDASESAPPTEDLTASGSGEEMETLTRERDDYLDQLQRSRAEFSNFQKRVKAQAELDRAYAVEGLAADLLNVLDSFDRGLEVARTSGAKTIVDGLEMVYKQALDVLAKHGVRPIAAEGQPFDPSQHEAIAQQPHGEVPEGTILKEAARGYMIRDRVLRPTRVVVSRQPDA